MKMKNKKREKKNKGENLATRKKENELKEKGKAIEHIRIKSKEEHKCQNMPLQLSELLKTKTIKRK